MSLWVKETKKVKKKAEGEAGCESLGTQSKRAKGQSGEIISVKISVQERNDGGQKGAVCSGSTKRVLLLALDFITSAVSTRLEEALVRDLLLINVLSCWRGWFTKQYIFFSAILEMG